MRFCRNGRLLCTCKPTFPGLGYESPKDPMQWFGGKHDAEQVHGGCAEQGAQKTRSLHSFCVLEVIACLTYPYPMCGE